MSVIITLADSMLGGALEQEEPGAKKKKLNGGRGEGGFQYGLGHIHSSCEIEDLVETHLCKLVCDTPIAGITHICRSLLYIIDVIAGLGWHRRCTSLYLQ